MHMSAPRAVVADVTDATDDNHDDDDAAAAVIMLRYAMHAMHSLVGGGTAI